ncbi:UAA transporter family domain-containing protein [Ditylenchus destructor]|nr:UAA transporter family domain-containing protein [Ditylenchus destructor]
MHGNHSMQHQQPDNFLLQQPDDSQISYQDWVPRLLIILLGYASVLLPFYCIIRIIQRRCRESDYNFRQTRFHKILRAFAVGHPEYQLVPSKQQPSTPINQSSDQNAQVIAAKSSRRRSFVRDCFKVFLYFAGIQVTLVCMGFFQEKIVTRGYARNADPTIEDKFEDAQFLVFVNRLVGFILAGAYFMYDWYRQPVHIPPLYTQSFASISNTISSWCQYEALKYVSFPTQTVCKASKVVPTMIMGRVLRKQRYSTTDYLMALSLVAGASLFFLSINQNGSTSKKSTGGANVLTQHSTTISGLILMFGYLMSDAFTPNFQKKLLEAKVSRCQMMFYMNGVSAFLCLASLFQQMSLFTSLAFVFSHNGIFADCFLLSLAGSLGQVFIYMTIDEFGPVALSVMMTMRQIFSIVLSSVYFSHPISILGVFGLAVCFGSIFADTYRKYFCDNTRTKIRR